ncbi:hypothetical protein LZ198_00625 [Myxococcus sp. K15C18031901]|uniref:hypothetical protein n=1 Tax=Myxococcus dinghuensis TaxID=2906761 RepID=UPI0020A6E488|nr:hypothetical protein [Myxococcus dinghuensis]MCP3097369.1 hypothetical protein [Myxococcus dinghuensis]
MLHVLAGILTTASLSSAIPTANPTPEEPDGPSPRACITLDAPGGGRAFVCKSWEVAGDGLFDGTWWTRSYTGNVQLHARMDGIVERAWNGQYLATQRFQLQLCNRGTGRCSGWW